MISIKIKTEPSFGGLQEKTFLEKRCDFFQRCQKPDETIYAYLEIVRNLAECCGFYKTEEELLIRDRLVSGLNDGDFQSKIIKAYENPSIDDILSILNSEIKNPYDEVELKDLNTDHFQDTNGTEDNGPYETKVEDVNCLDVNSKDIVDHASEEHINVEETEQRKNTRNSSDGLIKLFKLHGWAYPACSICKKSFEDFKYLKGHLVEHMINDKTDPSLNYNESKDKTCLICKREVGLDHDLILHYSVHVGQKAAILPKVNCSICSKLTAICYLIKHMHLHIDDKVLPCTLCDKKFKSKVLLKRHTRIHKDHETYFCDSCGKKFIRKVYLDAHKIKVHQALDPKIQTLECYLCKLQYKSLGTLKRHIYWHSLPKNYLCTQCGESFRVNNALQRHLMRADHDGENRKKFQCEICKRKFYDKTQFVNHRVVHTKERPYKCTYPNCNKAYSSPTNLRDHCRYHTGERPYSCNLCDYKCINSTYLKRHKLLVHIGKH